MNSEHFSHTSEECLALHKTDLSVYAKGIQQYDNELRLVTFVVKIYFLADPNDLGLSDPLDKHLGIMGLYWQVVKIYFPDVLLRPLRINYFCIIKSKGCNLHYNPLNKAVLWRLPMSLISY